MPVSELDFIPVGRPQLRVDASGILGAIQEGSKITILDLREGTTIAEIALDPDAASVKAGWLETPTRLLLVTCFARETTVQVFDPHELRAVIELWFPSQLQLVATSGVHGVVAGERIALFELHEDTLEAAPLPVVASAAGAAGSGLIALAVGDATIELWDGATRTHVRSLPVGAPIAALGGNARCVWWTTALDPRVIEVMPLDGRAARRRLVLPEALRSVAGDPRVDVVLCVGASGGVYVAHLDGSVPVELIDTGRHKRIHAAALVVGVRICALLAQAGRPIMLVELDVDVMPPVPFPGDDERAALANLAPIHATADTAKLLGERAELAPALAATIAVIDAMEGGGWPAVPFEQLLAETGAPEQAELRDALAVLTRAAVVVPTAGGLTLDPGARRVLAREPEPPRAGTLDPDHEVLTTLLAPRGALIVAIGGTAAQRARAVRAATRRRVEPLASTSTVGALRDLWLAGAIGFLAATDGDPLDWVDRMTSVPGRFAIGSDPAIAGELLARLRRRRATTVYRLSPERKLARVKVSANLEPLVTSTWKGMRVGTPTLRAVALRGTEDAIASAARSVAGAHGVVLQHIQIDNVAMARDTLAAGHPVLLLELAYELAPIDAHVIAAMIERAHGVVLVAAAELPAPIARVAPWLDV